MWEEAQAPSEQPCAGSGAVERLCSCHISVARAGGRGARSQEYSQTGEQDSHQDSPRQGRLLERASREKDISLLKNL